MEHRPLVVLLGDSILIDGIAVSLGQKEVQGMIHLNTPSLNVSDQLEVLKPDLVVFELDSPYASPAFTLLKKRPSIILVGLDLTCCRAIVLNSQHYIPPTLDDLCQMVQIKTDEKPDLPKGGK